MSSLVLGQDHGGVGSDTNIAANIVNPSNIILTITVPAGADANLPFAVAGTGGPVLLGICNPGGGVTWIAVPEALPPPAFVTAPVSTATSPRPIVDGVTDPVSPTSA